MTRIEIVVAPDGATALETKGFSGDACRWASVFLETALGQKLSDRASPEAASVSADDRLHLTS